MLIGTPVAAKEPDWMVQAMATPMEGMGGNVTTTCNHCWGTARKAMSVWGMLCQALTARTRTLTAHEGDQRFVGLYWIYRVVYDGTAWQ